MKQGHTIWNVECAQSSASWQYKYHSGGSWKIPDGSSSPPRNTMER